MVSFWIEIVRHIAIALLIIVCIFIYGIVRIIIKRRNEDANNSLRYPHNEQDNLSHDAGNAIKEPCVYPVREEKEPYQPYYHKQETKEQTAYSSVGSDLENKVANILRNLPGDDHYILQNLYVPNSYQGTTAEIDVIMIHPTGIYVFECKNYNAYIQCDDLNSEYWDVDYASGNHYQLYSPVRQNKGHILALERYLQTNGCCKSWIVFGDNAQLNVPENPYEYVLTRAGILRNDMKSALSMEREYYSKEDLEEIYRMLYPLTQVPEYVVQKHNEDARRRSTEASAERTEYTNYQRYSSYTNFETSYWNRQR